MAKFDYARMQGTASRLLDRFAQGTITLTRTTMTTPDPDEPWNQVPTDTVYTLAATASGVSSEFVDGTTILATDLLVVISPKMTDPSGAEVDTEILSGDTLSVDGKAVQTIKTMRLPAAGTLVAWKAIVRG